jgi:aquaporin NIP
MRDKSVASSYVTTVKLDSFREIAYSKELKRKLLAEFIGTFTLVFLGTGAIIVNSITQSLTHIGVAITFGLVVLALIYSFGHISGAHFNPAVTIALLSAKEISRREAILYILIQMIGASFASLFLLSIFGDIANLGATLPSQSWTQSFILEFVLTFILMMVIFASATHGKATKSFAGVAIGSTVALEAMFGAPISGASMNPARSFGYALISGTFEYLWIYLVATTLGALLAAIVYKFIHEQ